MFFPRCGSKVNDDARFCTRCGFCLTSERTYASVHVSSSLSAWITALMPLFIDSHIFFDRRRHVFNEEWPINALTVRASR